MKNRVQLIVCMIIFVHGTLLGNQVGKMTVGDAIFTCNHYTWEDNSLHLSEQNFEIILPKIIEKEKFCVQMEIDNPESTFTPGELSVSDYLVAHYRVAYQNFKDGQNQALVCTNQADQCMAIIFFSIDNSFGGALDIERQILLAQADQISRTQTPEFLNNMTNLIAEKICTDSSQMIVALPKGGKLIASYMQNVCGFMPCNYTGSKINLEEKVVCARPIAR